MYLGAGEPGPAVVLRLGFPKVWEAGAPQGGPLGYWGGGIWLFLMAASAWCRIIKVPDHPEALCFQIRGAAPPYVYAVGRGEWSLADGGILGNGSACGIGTQSRPNHHRQACTSQYTVATYFLCLKPRRAKANAYRGEAVTNV